MRYAFILLSLTLFLAACGSPAPDTIERKVHE